METSLLYNTEIVVNLFAMLGIVRYLRLNVGGGGKMVLGVSSLIAIAFPPLICTILYYWISFGVKRKHTVSILALFILAFVADAIFITTKFVLHKYLQGSWNSHNSNGFSIVKPVSMLTIMVWMVLYFILGETWFRFEFVAAATTIALVVLLSIMLIAKIPKVRDSQQPPALYVDRQLNYVVLLLGMLPPIIIGELYAIFKGNNTWGVYAILFPILVRLAIAPITKPIVVLQVCRFFIVFPLCCWRLLTLDIQNQILQHPLPTLILVVTTCDTIESLMK